MFVEKVFTNDESNNIIKKDYDPLKVNCKIYEREGLFMEEKEIVLKEKKNSKKFIKLLTKICLDLKVKNYKEEIKDFLLK